MEPSAPKTRGLDDLEMLDGAVGMRIALLQFNGLAGSDDQFVVAGRLRPKLRRGYFNRGLAKNLVRGEPFEPAEAGVDENKPVFQVLAEDADRQMLDQGVIQNRRFMVVGERRGIDQPFGVSRRLSARSVV